MTVFVWEQLFNQIQRDLAIFEDSSKTSQEGIKNRQWCQMVYDLPLVRFPLVKATCMWRTNGSVAVIKRCVS